jgi:hypothetical protein
VRGLFDNSRIFLGPSEVNPPTSFPPIRLTDAYVGAPVFAPGVDRGIWIWRVSPGGAWEIRCSTPLVNLDAFDGWLTDGSPIAGTTGHDLEVSGFTPGGPRVWRNDGGAFAEITASLALPGMVNPSDVSWVDYDNDGDLDLHVVDAGTSALPLAPDALFRNDGAAFADVTAAEGLAASLSGMGDGGVWGDVDGDLDADLFLQEGGGPFAFSQYGPSTLFRNEGDRGPALLADLRTTADGPEAIGAVATAWIAGRPIQRRVSANAWRGFQDPARLHFGLGGAVACDSLVVRWPSGAIDRFAPLAAGTWTLVAGGGVSATPAIDPLPEDAPWRVIALFPQPSRDTQVVVLALARPAVLDIALFDVSGRRIATWHRGQLPAGQNHLSWRPSPSVPAGVYFLRISDGNHDSAKRTIRLR